MHARCLQSVFDKKNPAIKQEAFRIVQHVFCKLQESAYCRPECPTEGIVARKIKYGSSCQRHWEFHQGLGHFYLKFQKVKAKLSSSKLKLRAHLPVWTLANRGAPTVGRFVGFSSLKASAQRVPLRKTCLGAQSCRKSKDFAGLLRTSCSHCPDTILIHFLSTPMTPRVS